MNNKTPALVRLLLVMVTMAGLPAWAGDYHSHQGHGQPYKSKTEAPAAVSHFPALNIISPKEGARVDPAIAVVFETPADLAEMTMSAKQIGVHLHVAIDDTSLMPVMEDLARLGRNRYRYVFDMPVEPGKHVVSVYWSDAQHKTIESTVRKVSVTVGASQATKRP